MKAYRRMLSKVGPALKCTSLSRMMSVLELVDWMAAMSASSRRLPPRFGVRRQS